MGRWTRPAVLMERADEKERAFVPALPASLGISDGLSPNDDPDRVDDARQVAEERQQNVQPEVQSDAHLEENADRRQEDCEKNANDVHGNSDWVCVAPITR